MNFKKLMYSILLTSGLTTLSSYAMESSTETKEQAIKKTWIDSLKKLNPLWAESAKMILNVEPELEPSLKGMIFALAPLATNTGYSKNTETSSEEPELWIDCLHNINPIFAFHILKLATQNPQYEIFLKIKQKEVEQFFSQKK